MFRSALSLYIMEARDKFHSDNYSLGYLKGLLDVMSKELPIERQEYYLEWVESAIERLKEDK